MHQSPQAAAQAVTDLAQRIGASQLTEQHGDELRPAGKAFGGTLSSVLLYEYGELGSGKVMEQLIKQACDLYDWVALLWAAFGEFPARNGPPTSIIGGHSSYFRLQEPVLDKSESGWLLAARRIHASWTRDVACNVSPGFSPRIQPWAIRLNWSYTSGVSRSRAALSPFFTRPNSSVMAGSISRSEERRGGK